MTVFADRVFVDEIIEPGGNEYRRCRFDGCIIKPAASRAAFSECYFKDCQVTPAFMALFMLQQRTMTDEEIDARAAKLDFEAVPVWAPKPASCMHAGYDYVHHGRCCPHCGAFMIDFGD